MAAGVLLAACQPADRFVGPSRTPPAPGPQAGEGFYGRATGAWTRPELLDLTAGSQCGGARPASLQVTAIPGGIEFDGVC
ncbi:hypothetical protein BCF33_2369 [Hasllibacter halocynthiae]|uniref:Uncharacterized protein n=1 Tax=Hasllibacter halocynthiae TaxID=595589 RepID=A0A2T0X3H7_9RHOB|nr:hypothetical protein [Hasllibacter halocynthiae]PRY93499.1 hypothetical protein BCF33_2369 [Hasllibacter halocynthiae]